MKSKTSCFNTTIFKKNITHYWPIWVIYLCYLLLAMPVSIWSMIKEGSGYFENAISRPYLIMSNALQAGLMPAPIFIASIIAAMAVFSYLYTAKNANMIHSLPVNRFELYVTNYISGFCFLIVPELITFVVSVLVCVANGISCIQYLLIWFLYAAGMTFFAYSMAVFVAMFTGQILAFPVYYFIINYLYIGCVLLLDGFESMVCYGVSANWNPGPSSILSPLYYLNNNVRVSSSYENGSDIVTSLDIKGGSLIAIYALVGIVFVIFAYWLYKKRRIETAGDLISIGVVKPVFRWGVALCGGFTLSFVVISILNIYQPNKVYSAFIVSIMICGFICFFAAEMMLEKCFRVFQKKRLIEWGGFTVAAVLFILLFKVDAFGIERMQPAAEEIEQAFAYMDYPMMLEEDEVSDILQIQREIIEHKEEYLKIAEKDRGYYYVTFRYYLTDGTRYERRYPLPLGEAYLSDETSPTARLLSMERETERLAEQIISRNYEENEYYASSIDLYTQDGQNRSYTLDSVETEKILQAIKADIEEGNFDDYYIRSTAPEEAEAYMNGINLNYYNKSEVYGNWDYYYNYDNGTVADAVYGGSSGSYITFGAKCKNVIDTLKELRIIDDEWKLLTSEEYQRAFED